MQVMSAELIRVVSNDEYTLSIATFIPVAGGEGDFPSTSPSSRFLERQSRSIATDATQSLQFLMLLLPCIN
ncbi:hypothetical protein P8452_60858 [Trifolium repens]|nr:hypothetical protein P8452_60858 [Trifolium repens]